MRGYWVVVSDVVSRAESWVRLTDIYWAYGGPVDGLQFGYCQRFLGGVLGCVVMAEMWFTSSIGYWVVVAVLGVGIAGCIVL